MSDVVIKGMEMPNTCRRCIEMEIPIRCRVMKEEPVTAVMSGYDRPSDCHLVELPPHGELVERSKVHEAISQAYCLEDVPSIIDQLVPTVLEAST